MSKFENGMFTVTFVFIVGSSSNDFSLTLSPSLTSSRLLTPSLQSSRTYLILPAFAFHPFTITSHPLTFTFLLFYPVPYWPKFRLYPRSLIDFLTVCLYDKGVNDRA